MPRFNSQGWEKISRPCTECGIDAFYVKRVEDIRNTPVMDTKQFHKRSCKQLPVLGFKDEGVVIRDVEFREIEEEDQLTNSNNI